ncbi:hypothetical protein GCM10022254_43160 [Actinomadura meridiana]|uniref:PIN domain-containing protein n=1 Tax=Actinomadura meridiana TaxID=559626 RepID=A0ABP8C8K2_9ACTN
MIKLLVEGKIPYERTGTHRRILLGDLLAHSERRRAAQGWEGLEGSYGLPDPNDEHVVAAAVVTGAGVIVTHNTKDFPPARLPGGLAVIPPAEFAANNAAPHPLKALAAVEAIVERSGTRGPKRTEEDVLAVLAERYRMNDAVEIMREARK